MYDFIRALFNAEPPPKPHSSLLLLLSDLEKTRTEAVEYQMDPPRTISVSRRLRVNTSTSERPVLCRLAWCCVVQSHRPILSYGSGRRRSCSSSSSSFSSLLLLLVYKVVKFSRSRSTFRKCARFSRRRVRVRVRECDFIHRRAVDRFGTEHGIASKTRTTSFHHHSSFLRSYRRLCRRPPPTSGEGRKRPSGVGMFERGEKIF